MEDEREERSPAYIIPRNYEDSFITAGGMSFRSIAEGAILALIIVPIFIFLPIRLMYRAILIAIFGGILFGFGIIGIKHCYVSEFILKFLNFKRASHTVERNDDGMFDELEGLVKKANAEFEKENPEAVEQPTVATDTQQTENAVAENNSKKKNRKKEKRAKGKRAKITHQKNIFR